MVTTMRQSEQFNNVYENNNVRGGVSVMERPRTFEETKNETTQENAQEARIRMQRNLDKLLNYDKYINEEKAEEQTVVAEPEVKATADEDITPTSTTMQFGDDIEQIRKEMNKVAEDEASSYRLNKKGKVAVILYSLIVTVILALIVINTGVLATLNNKNISKEATLNSYVESYNSVQADIDSISNSDYISNMAENEFGMVRK